MRQASRRSAILRSIFHATTPIPAGIFGGARHGHSRLSTLRSPTPCSSIISMSPALLLKHGADINTRWSFPFDKAAKTTQPYPQVIAEQS
jgi:hypothetical protein